MDAYAFIETKLGEARNVMNELVSSGIAVRAVAVSGIYNVIGRLEVDDHLALAEMLLDRTPALSGVTAVTEAIALTGEDAGLPIPIPDVPMKVPELQDVTAFVLATVDDVLERLGDPLGQVEGLEGVAVLIGSRFDLLLKVGASSALALGMTVVRSIASIPGIASTSTLFMLDATPPIGG